MRRLLLVNALIFAILAAAVALAYYGYSGSSGVASRERELQLMHEIAEEKVLNIGALISEDDKKLFQAIQLDQLVNLGDIIKNVNAAVSSVFVLDDQLKVVPDGSWGKNPKDAIEFRDWFVAERVPKLNLVKQKVGERGHEHGQHDGKPYLVSFTRKVAGDRTFYVLVEDDLYHLVWSVFPQYFEFKSSKRLYQVADEHGGFIYGTPFADRAEELVAEVSFVDTVDGWVLRVADKDLDVQKSLGRRRIIDSMLIGGAVAVILVGLGFLALAIRRERRANELKSDFISNVSHELKTPLSIISMFGEMLANGRTKSSEQATEYAEIIWRESVRLGRLIDNVLDFAKIERGMGVYEFAEADIGEVVTRAVELVGRRLATAEMTLDVDVEPGLPQVKLDVNAFTLGVLNLIDNAIKYAPSGKKIEVRVKKAGDHVVVAVRDWGPGIDPDEQEQIFERFYRARSVRLKPIRGSGIGLALVRHIARAHGGDVSVETAPDHGATFQISLPI
jgi:two-component system phosphate regulon sensor histidine kinase PhoR